MTITGAPPTKSARPDVRGSTSVRRSGLMLPVFVVALIVTTILGSWFLSPLGLRKGELLLMAHSVGGWAAEATVTILLLGPPVAGVLFALGAMRRDAKRAWVWLVLNGALAVWVLYMLADDIRMSYFPH